MEEFKRPRLPSSKNLPFPNEYTEGLDGEYRDYAFNEERAPEFKGRWRQDVFKVDESAPLDLEIGTGNGTHFQHYVKNHPERSVVGMEIKYKPLIQTIRGALRNKNYNGRVVRYHAFNLDLLFNSGELNNIFLHFPDPWVTPRKPKNRFVNPRMLDIIWDLQRPGSFFEFKTDSREYFLWALPYMEESKYDIEFQTLDLHNSEQKEKNFITQFETIFMRKNIQINYIRLRKP